MKAVALLLLLSSAALAADPVAVVSGKKVAKTGDLIVLDSKDSTADTKRKWTVWPELTGTASQVNENLERWAAALREHGATVVMPSEADDSLSIAIEGDNKLVLASYPGVYRVLLAVSNADGIAVAKWTVTVSGTTAPPEPPGEPDPPSEPQPPPPPPGVANRFDLEASCRLWLVQIPNETLAEKPAMRQVFATIGQGAADGKYATAKDVETGLSKTLKDAGANKLITTAAWNSWGKSASAAIVALQSAGKIASAQDYGQALLEIAEGLKP